MVGGGALSCMGYHGDIMGISWGYHGDMGWDINGIMGQWDIIWNEIYHRDIEWENGMDYKLPDG